MDPVFAGIIPSCFFIAHKNQAILGILSFITLKFFSVVPATNSHADTAHSKVSYWSLFPEQSFLVSPTPTHTSEMVIQNALQELNNNFEKMLNTTVRNLLAWLAQCGYSRYCIRTVLAHWKSRGSLGRKRTQEKSLTLRILGFSTVKIKNPMCDSPSLIV